MISNREIKFFQKKMGTRDTFFILKRIKICYTHVSSPYKEWNCHVLQTGTNKK